MAGDIVAMPTGNSVAPRNVQLNYIHWDLENPVYGPEQTGRAPGSADIYEGFFGVTDRLELDVLHVDLDGVDNFTEVNAYLTLVKETAAHPSVILGATNVLGSDWLDGLDNISPFLLGAYNINVPQGPPSFNDPLMRLHLGYGSDYHEGWFGGLQGLLQPWLGFAILNYQNQPSYMGTIIPCKSVELTYGTKNGDPFYRAGLFFDW
jgi:hypothetical protein